MQRQLAAFVEQPSKKNYLAARDAVLNQSPLPLDAADLEAIERLLDEQEYEQVLLRLDLLPPSKVLSPRVHFLAAEAASALGQEDEVELERSLFVITLQGLLATGDGTRGNPYCVCHASDEYDVVETLGAEPAGQSLIECDGRLCDAILCSDGREICFDVSCLLQARRKPKALSPRRRSLKLKVRARRPRLRAKS